MKALIFVEKKDGSPVGASLELFSAAQALGAEAVAVAVAPAEGGLLEDAITDAVAKKAEECGADLVLLAATPIGKLVCARIAARIGAGSVNDAIALACEDGKLQVTRPVYGGTIQETLQVETKAAVVSVRGASYPAPETVPAIEEISSDAELRAKVVELIAEAGEAVNLEDAKVIVTGGRGIGSEENLGLCKELAEVLGGAVGGTRPVIENGWLPRVQQVGQSGKIVAPELYIACGVSGATQHISGMSGSKYIIAINKDEEAPIFSIADLGIVGDVKKILPLMIEEFRKKKA
ncbi:MAG: electron transfer flavoprotein subunit alpha/FixB family protein [Clostridium sp.]|nr:electron transfer flavoprotein subunit alpha/FixB family protein [Clostridium sp.]MBP3215343.1 electron transfer flavoprotein subunit alpha/FixB family protein [Clostridium sp.]